MNINDMGGVYMCVILTAKEITNKKRDCVLNFSIRFIIYIYNQQYITLLQLKGVIGIS